MCPGLKAISFEEESRGGGYYGTPIVENQMDKKMENEMETLSPCRGLYRDITPNNGESNG